MNVRPQEHFRGEVSDGKALLARKIQQCEISREESSVTEEFSCSFFSCDFWLTPQAINYHIKYHYYTANKSRIALAITSRGN
jgi:hypothetical protein